MTATPFADGFADRLRKARERAGLTQRDLGDAADVNYSQISRYEKGIAFPRPGVLLRLAQVLGTSMEYLRDAEPVQEVAVYFGDGEENALWFNISQADMQLVRNEAQRTGRTVEDVLLSMIRAGMSFIAGNSGLIPADAAKPPKPKRKR